jgi:hypothetical protein
LERILRIAVMAFAVVAAVGATVADRGPLALHARPAAHLATFDLMPPPLVVPAEQTGRVERWQNARLLAAEAQAAAEAAAAQAAAAKARAKPVVATPGPASTSIPSYPAGTVQAIITRAFTPLGPTAVAWGLRVARCESGYNPRAYNGAGPYYGLFQFLMSTFNATPYRGQDIYDPVANANAAAWKYSQGGAGAWGCQ